MTTSRYTIVLTLSKPHTNGKCSVRFRVAYKGKRIELHSGITLLPRQWSKQKERIKQGAKVNGYEYHILNNLLNEQEEFIGNYFNQSAIRNNNTTLEDLKSRFNYQYKSRPEERTNEFFFLFDEYITEKEDEWGKDMKNVVTRLKNRIFKIAPDISFAGLTISTMDNIKRNLATTMYNDAIEKHLSYLKSFVIWAKNKNYQINDEYFAFKPKLPKAKKAVRYLELNELETIYHLDLSQNEALDRTRDLFIFQCYTALRYSDLRQLKRQNIKIDPQTGDYYIDIVTEKDDDRVTYRLAKRATEIYKKYAEYVYDNDLAFPVLSNQKYNEHLKELGKKANLKGVWIDTEYKLLEKIEVKIPKCDLTTHTARRTFVVTAMNEGADLNLIATITSHSDFDAMKPYIKANRRGTDMVIDFVDKATSKLKEKA